MTEEIINHHFAGHTFHFYNTPTLPSLISEIFSDNYKILHNNLTFSRGDTILDIGANEGIFSILMAKLFPKAQIVSVEPVPRTFYQMIRNIGLNGVTNITPVNLGVGAKNDTVTMIVSNEFSGGSTSLMTYNPETTHKVEVGIVPLDSIFYSYVDNAYVKLLKMDIEGMEYDALYNSRLLSTVDYFVGELHINRKLSAMGHSIEKLSKYIAERTNLIYYEPCNMAE